MGDIMEEVENGVVTLKEEVEDNETSSALLLDLLEKSVGLPGVKINRTAFIMETFKVDAVQTTDPELFSRISLEEMDKAVSNIITKNVTASSSAAFALGLPGGFAMAASIPADIMQNFAFSLRLAQQIAYAYGFNDIFENGELTQDSKNTLILFLGIMFMANGSGAVLRAVSPNVGKYVGKQVMSKPLTKTVWYPALKNITKVVSSKTLSKNTLKGIATKSIPIIGGVASAGINVATMIPMANRLKNELRKYHLPEEEIIEIIEMDQRSFGDKASDFISDAFANTVKAASSTKKLGAKFGDFVKDVNNKTKDKLK